MAAQDEELEQPITVSEDDTLAAPPDTSNSQPSGPPLVPWKSIAADPRFAAATPQVRLAIADKWGDAIKSKFGDTPDVNKRIDDLKDQVGNRPGHLMDVVDKFGDAAGGAVLHQMAGVLRAVESGAKAMAGADIPEVAPESGQPLTSVAGFLESKANPATNPALNLGNPRYNKTVIDQVSTALGATTPLLMESLGSGGGAALLAGLQTKSEAYDEKLDEGLKAGMPQDAAESQAEDYSNGKMLQTVPQFGLFLAGGALSAKVAGSLLKTAPQWLKVLGTGAASFGTNVAIQDVNKNLSLGADGKPLDPSVSVGDITTAAAFAVHPTLEVMAGAHTAGVLAHNEIIKELAAIDSNPATDAVAKAQLRDTLLNSVADSAQRELIASDYEARKAANPLHTASDEAAASGAPAVAAASKAIAKDVEDAKLEQELQARAEAAQKIIDAKTPAPEPARGYRSPEEYLERIDKQKAKRASIASEPQVFVPKAEEPTQVASVPVMITKAMEEKLAARGYDLMARNKLTPQEANDILAEPEATPVEAPVVTPEAPVASPAPTVEEPPPPPVTLPDILAKLQKDNAPTPRPLQPYDITRDPLNFVSLAETRVDPSDGEAVNAEVAKIAAERGFNLVEGEPEPVAPVEPAVETPVAVDPDRKAAVDTHFEDPKNYRTLTDLAKKYIQKRKINAQPADLVHEVYDTAIKRPTVKLDTLDKVAWNIFEDKFGRIQEREQAKTESMEAPATLGSEVTKGETIATPELNPREHMTQKELQQNFWTQFRSTLTPEKNKVLDTVVTKAAQQVAGKKVGGGRPTKAQQEVIRDLAEFKQIYEQHKLLPSQPIREVGTGIAPTEEGLLAVSNAGAARPAEPIGERSVSQPSRPPARPRGSAEFRLDPKDVVTPRKEQLGLRVEENFKNGGLTAAAVEDIKTQIAEAKNSVDLNKVEARLDATRGTKAGGLANPLLGPDGTEFVSSEGELIPVTTAQVVKVHRAYNFGKGIQEVLRAIGQRSDRSDYRGLANVFSRVVDPRTSIRLDSTLHTDLAGGLFTPNEKAGHIDINPYFSSHFIEQAVLHETYHALMHDKIARYEKGDLNTLSSREILSLDRLESIRQDMIEKFAPKEIAEFERVHSDSRDWADSFIKKFGNDQSLARWYFAMNLQEFGAGLTSNPDFQDVLRMLPAEPAIGYRGRRTFWDRIVDVVSNLFGVRPGTGLQVALKEAMELLRSKAKPALFNDGAAMAIPNFRTRTSGIDDVLSDKGRLLDVVQHTRDAEARARGEEPNEIDLRNLVRQHYAEASTGAQSLADRLESIGGLDTHTAAALEKSFTRAIEAARPARSITEKSPYALGITADNKPVKWLAENGKRLFTAEGNLPREVFDAWIKRNGEVKEESRQAAYATRDLYAALCHIYKIGKTESIFKGLKRVPIEFVQAMDRTLKGEEDINKMPEPLRDPLQRLRQHVDALTQKMIAEGMVPEPLQAKLANNLGVYLTRSYRIFDDPKWNAKIDPQVRNRQREVIRTEIIDSRARKAALDDATSKGITVTKDYMESGAFKKAFDDAKLRLSADPDIVTEASAQLNSQLQDWADQGDQALLGRGSRLGSKDLTTFIARKDLPATLREVMGEYKDPVINYVRSIAKQARIIGDTRFLNEVKATGMGKFLFEDGKQPATHSSLIAAEGSATMAPLNGLRTTPEIAEAFREFGKGKEIQNGFLKAYMRLNALAKSSKTVGSILTQARNITGQPIFMMGSGHFDPRPFGDALKAIAADTGVANNKVWEESYLRYLKLGLVDQSTRANELRAVVKDAALNSDQVVGLDSKGQALRSLKKVFVDAPTRAYQVADDLGKIVGFENELARQKLVHPEMTQNQVETHAAQIIRNTYPTYSMVPEWVKQLRRQPVLGPFMTFAYETFRTEYHNLRYMTEDLFHAQNAAQRRVGVQRMIGQMGLLGGAYAIGAMARHMLGLSVKDEDDLRRFLPDWDKNAALMFTNTEPGKANYINLSYTNPYSYLTDPFVAAMSGIRTHEGLLPVMARSAAELLRPFTSEDILAGAMFDIARNKTQSGAQVWNSQDTPDQKFEAMMARIYGAVEPGSLTRLRKKIIPGMEGKMTPYGSAIDPTTELVSEFTGVKQQTLDYEQALSFKARDFREANSQVDGIFSSVALRRGDVTPEEVSGAYKRSNEQRFRLWKEMYDDAIAAQNRGVSKKALIQTLSEGGVQAEEARDILRGKYVPYELGQQSIDKLRRLGRKVPPEVKAEVHKTRHLMLSGDYPE